MKQALTNIEDKETQDQIALVLLLKGTREQQLEALQYCGFKSISKQASKEESK